MKIIWEKVTYTEARQKKPNTQIICIPEVNSKAREKNMENHDSRIFIWIKNKTSNYNF